MISYLQEAQKEKESLLEQFAPLAEQLSNASNRVKPLLAELEEVKTRKDENETKKNNFAVRYPFFPYRKSLECTFQTVREKALMAQLQAKKNVIHWDGKKKKLEEDLVEKNKKQEFIEKEFEVSLSDKARTSEKTN